ncbi:hypothetical protein [Capnocytophaga catalasegens]|uniref:Lipoprotein n=1 Tax=Capnocytophaga catalasegens TaxID=1004260 RepID=A0AAV5AS51_9FLAO|nr:hypothetical protein [Capnocytophaga catalasegens]GIZ15873.1 hypothetical protein RCZ03_18730 [Capnocytophaga catalasegens]GJM50142.1 hypothetical protein RCZ15_11160 [Capnocytophaga catalasegens]GJM52631.1 hypothetical protein RCZ16_09480 [Capnocytophaga catalasegens]
MRIVFLIIIASTLFFCDNKHINKQRKEELRDCIIPNNVLAYIQSNKDFELIDIQKQFSEDFWNYYRIQKKSLCPIVCYGDFNYDNEKDIAVIVNYKEYKSGTYPKHIFPFLVIFHSYEKEIKTPYIVYKTDDYKEETVKSVIYDQFENGIWSYIQTGQKNEKDIVEIVIPEKSSFYVYWDDIKKQYRYRNSLDDDYDYNYNPKLEDLFKGEYVFSTFNKDNIKYQYIINIKNLNNIDLIIEEDEDQYEYKKMEASIIDNNKLKIVFDSKLDEMGIIYLECIDSLYYISGAPIYFINIGTESEELDKIK